MTMPIYLFSKPVEHKQISAPTSQSAESSNATKPTIGSDCNGTITNVILQYSTRDPDNGKGLSKVCIELFRSFPPEVEFTILIEDPRDEIVLRKEIETSGLDQSRFKFVVVSRRGTYAKTLSPWARDVMIPLNGPDGKTILLEPNEACQYKEHTDKNSAEAISKKNKNFEIKNSPYCFQGGDIVSSESTVFISSARIVAGGFSGPEEAQKVFGKPVVIVNIPGRSFLPGHIDMFITPVGINPETGKEIVLVGDPRLTGAAEADMNTVALDRIASDLDAQGFEVVRIPIKTPLDNNGLNNIVTYNNVIMETRNGKKVVYMPVYGGENVDYDKKAIQTYESLGFNVVPVDVSSYQGHCGQIRCMTVTIKK